MATPEYGLQKDGSIAEIQKSDNSLSAQSLIFQKLNKGDAQTTQMRTFGDACYTIDPRPNLLPPGSESLRDILRNPYFLHIP